ncbi:hypothetical protein Tco_0906057 [Tanacetum coccineum]
MVISICKKKYAREILARFNMEDCNGVKNPIAPGFKLVKDDHSGHVNATLYKQMVRHQPDDHQLFRRPVEAAQGFNFSVVTTLVSISAGFFAPRIFFKDNVPSLTNSRI